MKNLSDREIIESVLKGNSADFVFIIDRYKNKAFSMLKRMLKNNEDAEELLQDCFLKAYNKLKSFKFESKFSTWFYRIVYNTALTKLSGKKRQIENDMADIDEFHNIQSKYSADEFIEYDLSDTVRKIVNELPEKNAAIITLFYLEEMTCEEISDVLKITINNVKVLLHRSRNLLKEIIEKKNLKQEIL
ncbi:MAG: RNA polymerase sigma factor [Ignavibacteriaceae bacterium]|nr:RNA polymerase sigma factor [Ignavibacteriaceae bacterium]